MPDHSHMKLPLSGLILFCALLAGKPAFGQTVEWRIQKRFIKENIVGNELYGQVSRFTDNMTVNFGRNSFCKWEVDLLGLNDAQKALALLILQKRWMFAVNQHVGLGKDQNIADLLQHGAISSGDWGVYSSNLYLARGRVIDDKGEPLTLKEVAMKHPELGSILKTPGVEIVIRATKVGVPDNVSEWSPHLGWGGVPKEIVMPDLAGWRITGFSIQSEKVVDSFWVHYIDPSGKECHAGFGCDSNWGMLPTIRFGADEHITRVKGGGGGLLDRVQFLTDKDRSAVFGGGGGDAFNFSAPGKVLVGVQFSCGGSIDRIRFVWR